MVMCQAGLQPADLEREQLGVGAQWKCCSQEPSLQTHIPQPSGEDHLHNYKDHKFCTSPISEHFPFGYSMFLQIPTINCPNGLCSHLMQLHKNVLALRWKAAPLRVDLHGNRVCAARPIHG